MEEVVPFPSLPPNWTYAFSAGIGKYVFWEHGAQHLTRTTHPLTMLQYNKPAPPADGVIAAAIGAIDVMEPWVLNAVACLINPQAGPWMTAGEQRALVKVDKIMLA